MLKKIYLFVCLKGLSWVGGGSYNDSSIKCDAKWVGCYPTGVIRPSGLHATVSIYTSPPPPLTLIILCYLIHLERHTIDYHNHGGIVQNLSV